ncbi:MAG: hypothetical protein ACK4F7_02905 [Inhella sp.]
MIRYSVAAASLLALSLALPAWAAGEHDPRPQHGGIVVEAAHLDWELVATPARIVIHVRDHGKKASTAGASGKLTLLSGKTKSEAVLKPAGDDRLEAEGPFDLAAGIKLVASVQLAGRKPAQVRFVLK